MVSIQSTQLIHEKANDSMRKFSYLMSHLKEGSYPHELVYGFETSPAGYTAAWKSLCDAFDNEHRLVMSTLSKYLDMQVMPNNPNRNDVMALVTKTTQLTLTLPNYGVDVKSWDTMLIAILLKKVDNRFKAKWIVTNMSHQLPKLSDFLEFLKSRAETIQSEGNCEPAQSSAVRPTHQSVQQPRLTNENSNGHRQSKSMPSGKGQQVTKKTIEERNREIAEKKCPMCKLLGHRLFACSEFTALSFPERIQKARELKVCNRCLRVTCSPAKCTMGPCSCGELHNRALCEEHAKKQKSCWQPHHLHQQLQGLNRGFDEPPAKKRKKQFNRKSK